jgi:protein-tyrosine phosphatase
MPKTYRTAVWFAVASISVLLWSPVGCSEHGEPIASATKGPSAQPEPDRRVVLDGQPNFRDLGGYETADGRTVKRGQVYRSGELPRLTEADLEQLEELRISTVVNFLTDTEIEYHGRDRVPDGVREISLPIENDEGLAAAIVEARKTADFSKVPVELNPEIHAMLPDQARSQYADLLRAIGKSGNRPIVFHCSHGVHRTGTAAAILLWSLGVPWEAIRADYLLSNEYRREEVQQRLAKLRQRAAERQGVDPEDVDMTNINAFYILSGEYIDATRDWILAEYGSIDGYLRDGLGLSGADINRLREGLLE